MKLLADLHAGDWFEYNNNIWIVCQEDHFDHKTICCNPHDGILKYFMNDLKVYPIKKVYCDKTNGVS